MFALLLVFGLIQAPQTPQAAGTLGFTPPAEWKARPASSSMRVAEFILPRTADADADGELIVYYFGGTGGSVDANIERWTGQMQTPEGAAVAPPARDSRTINGLKVTTVDVAGTYIAEVRPGSSERHNKPGYRMRASVIETPRGPYFIKAVGPTATMAKWEPAFAEFLKSLRFIP
jgi:hypothetical protein